MSEKGYSFTTPARCRAKVCSLLNRSVNTSVTASGQQVHVVPPADLETHNESCVALLLQLRPFASLILWKRRVRARYIMHACLDRDRWSRLLMTMMCLCLSWTHSTTRCAVPPCDAFLAFIIPWKSHRLLFMCFHIYACTVHDLHETVIVRNESTGRGLGQRQPWIGLMRQFWIYWRSVRFPLSIL